MSAVIGIVVILVVVVGAGLAFYFLTRPKKTGGGPSPAPAPVPVPVPVGKCTTATQASKCSVPKPYCYTPPGASFGDCVECNASSDCSTGKVCTNNMCVNGCTADSQCTGGKFCKLSTAECVQCTATTQCGTGKVCNPSTNLCDTPTTPSASTCTTQEGCASNAVNKYCLVPPGEASGVCVQCKEQSHCSGLTSFCNTSTNKCVAPGCTTNASCPSGKVCKVSTGVCVNCNSNSDCSSGNVCNLTSNTCAPAPAAQFYLKENSGPCTNGSKPSVISDGVAFRSTPLSFGASICNEVPLNNQVYFYRVNDVTCPSGSQTLGWIKQSAMDTFTNPAINGLTVCRAPAGYVIPDDQKISLVNNFSNCPGNSQRIAWVKNTSVNVADADSKSYGLTICRAP